MAKQFLCGSVVPFTVERVTGMSFSVEYCGLLGMMEYDPNIQDYRWTIPSTGVFGVSALLAEGLKTLCAALIRLDQKSWAQVSDIKFQTQSLNVFLEAIPDDSPLELNRLMELLSYL